MDSKILSIVNLQGKTAYNPTSPIEFDRKRYLGLRVESLESETDTQTLFAYERQQGNILAIDYSINSLPLQDPTFAIIKGYTLMSGVKVWEENEGIKWRQDFYIGDSIRSLEYLCSGPVGMKDTRLVELEDRIGVFTRPQGKIGVKGKIGYMVIGKVDELKTLTEVDWYSGKIIEMLFNGDQWVGVNQAIRLPEDKIGVIGHIAHQTTNRNGVLEKHYYALSFVFNSKTRMHSGFSIIARRNDFPPSPSKRSPELDDVIFPAGIDEENYLYCGLSDFCVGKKKIKKLF